MNQQYENRDISLVEFQKFIESTDIPVIAYFWAPNSEPCKHQKKIIDELTDELDGKVGIVEVNVVEFPALKEAFQLQIIPGMALFKNGVMVDGTIGYTPKVVIYSKLGELFDKPFNTIRTPDSIIQGTLSAPCID